MSADNTTELGLLVAVPNFTPEESRMIASYVQTDWSTVPVSPESSAIRLEDFDFDQLVEVLSALQHLY